MPPKVSNNAFPVTPIGLRRTLLGGTSALAVAATALAVGHAAADQIITTSQSTSILGDNGAVTVNPGVTVDQPSFPAVRSLFSFGITTLTNNGSLITTGPNPAVLNDNNILTVINSGMIAGGGQGILNDATAMVGALVNGASGFISSVVNNGVIGNGSTAISNAGTIAALTNNATISGTDHGIVNTTGTIGSILNAGTISGSVSGITNNAGGTFGALTNSGSIDTVINAGRIGPGGSIAFDNSGTIGTLTNSGPIAGTVLGVRTTGSLRVLNISNGGTVSGTQGSGLYNTGVIGVMNNAGILNGGSYGIENYGAIPSLSNSGTIGGGMVAAICNCSSGGNAGNIGSLANSGTITGTAGAAGILSTGAGAAIGPITNSGLIYGPVQIASQDVTIAGGIGTIFGTLAGGTISVLNGNLTFSSGNQLLDDDMIVSSPSGVAGGGTVFNTGVLQVNTAHAITGAYNQSSNGTLVIGIGGTLSGQYGRLTTNGAATFAGGLAVTTLGGFAAASGQRYDIFNFASRTGDFTSFSYNGTAWTADGTDVWTNGTATLNEIFVGTTELDLVLGQTFVPPLTPPPVPPRLAHNIDTSRSSYLASNLGTTVNPVFEGGVLQTNQPNASYQQNFSLAPGVANTIDQIGNASLFSGVYADATVGQPGSIVVSNSGTGGSVTFSGVNTYTGSTTVNPGATLMLTGAGSVATSSGVTDNGTFNVAGVNAQTSIVTLSGSGAVPLGNNTLTLTRASDTFAGSFSGNGSVTLASGAETLTGTSTIGGTLAVDGGALHQDGTFTAGAVTVDSGGTLRGTGLIAAPTSVTGVLAPGDSPGTMTFTAPVTFGSAATLALDIDGMGTGNGAGNYSRVVVQGASFTAAGAIAPLLRGITGSANNTFSPPVGSVYNAVLATGGVQGSFATLAQPATGLLPGTHFDALYSPTTINLYITPASYAQLPALGVAETVTEADIGRGVDTLRGVPGVRLDPSTSALLDTLYRLPGPAIPPVLDGLNNNIYGDLLFGGIERNRAFAATLNGQSAADRGFMAPAGASMQQVGPLTLWITGIGGSGSVNGSSGRWSANSGGGAVGAGRRMGDFTLGIAVGGSGGSLSAGSQSAATQSVSLGMYGGWQRGRWFVEGDLDVFGTDDTTTRTIPLGNLRARGHARGTGVGGGVETGMVLRAGAATVEPFVGLHVDYLNRGASSEEGAGVFNETIGSASATSVRSSIGVRGETTISLGGMQLTPSASLAWAHELGDVSTTTSSGFAGGPAVLSLSSQNGGRDAAVIGIGARTPITDRLGIYARYTADLRRDATSQVFSAGLRWIW